MSSSNKILCCTASFRINELTILNERLKVQLTDKDKTIGQLQRNISSLEARRTTNGTHGGLDVIDQVDSAQLLSATPPAPEGDYNKQEREEIDAMHEALRKIASEVGYSNLILRESCGTQILVTFKQSIFKLVQLPCQAITECRIIFCYLKILKELGTEKMYVYI